MKFDCLGRIVSLNDRNTILVKLSFTQIEQLEAIEDAIESNRILKMSFTTNFKIGKSYEQLKRLFAMMKQAIISIGDPPSKHNMTIMDMHIKSRRYYPKEQDRYGGSTAMLPKSKANLTMEEMSRVMQGFEIEYQEAFTAEKGWNEDE